MTQRLDDALAIARQAAELRLKRVWSHRKKVASPLEVESALRELRGAPAPEPLREWARRLGLSALETEVFATLAALRTERGLAMQVGELLGTYGRTTPTVSILALMLEPTWGTLELHEALRGHGRLRLLGLIDLLDLGAPLDERRLSVSDWALRAFAGLSRELPELLRPLGFWMAEPELPLPQIDEGLRSTVSAHLAAGADPCTVVFEGERGAGRKQLGRVMAGRPLLVADLTLLSGDEAVFGAVVETTLGFALAHGALPWFELGDGRDAHGAPVVRDVTEEGAARPSEASSRPSWRERRLLADRLEAYGAPAAASVGPHDAWRWGTSRHPSLRVVTPESDLPVQERAWDESSDRLGVALEPAVMARRFPLTVRGIRRVSERVEARHRAGLGASVESLLGEAREGLRKDTGMLARPVVTDLGWDDLVLPDDLRTQIDEVITSARHRETVLGRYGMRRWGKGGFHILLAGEPGTGKTTLATLMGKALDRETLQVNLDQVFSRYVGETEKHLVRVFALAERSQSLLLLDEADALLAQRTDVKQANDRFGNLAVNVVLQLMEQYDIISVATTNRESGLDEASTRRFSYRFTIPPPDVEQRARLFRKMLPEGVTIDADLDWDWLAEKVEVTGGLIRNIMMRMAALAAANGDVLTTELAAAAVNREMMQLGRLPIRLED
ncbi:MAG: ATP-binding protein [Deltaproteobacteria bacterium]|nr:ATP-binding protein [Deltaproteobacteria bacterium]MCB9788920.1 ATP-binding protein [Deltaproteobacteria bacterium]